MLSHDLDDSQLDSIPHTANSSASSSASSSSPTSPFRPEFHRRLLIGTSGWSDPTIGRCGKFYPPHTSAHDRLKYYSKHFPHVEVDSSNYAIPPRSRVQSWLNDTPPHFLFHFKALNIFTGSTIKALAVPKILRHLFSSSIHSSLNSDTTIGPAQCSMELLSGLWKEFNNSLLPAYESGKLGCVIFQFHLNFNPTPANRLFIAEARKQLDSRYQMAVELRNRNWWNTEEKLLDVGNWLYSLNCLFVTEDDLQHETYSPNQPPPLVKDIVHLPIVLQLTRPWALYIRLHRRIGQHRLLSASEISDWIQRIAYISQHQQNYVTNNGSSVAVKLAGPIFFLLGTDWEDQPIINARGIENQLIEYERKTGQFGTPASLHLDWKSWIKEVEKSSKTAIRAFFGEIKKKIPDEEEEHEKIEEIIEESSSKNSIEAAEVKKIEENTESTIQIVSKNNNQNNVNEIIDDKEDDEEEVKFIRMDRETEILKSPIKPRSTPIKSTPSPSPSKKRKTMHSTPPVHNGKSITDFFSKR